MNKNNLLQALKICRPALGEPMIKGLDFYHFNGKAVSAFNGVMLINTELEEEFPITGSIAGESLYKLISELDKDIELIVQEDTLIVKSGRSKTTFPVEQIDLEFLGDVEETAGCSYLPTQLLFAAGLKRCMSSVGGKGIPHDEIGVHVFIDNPSGDSSTRSECRMYSNNGIIYSRFICPLEHETTLNQVFLPATFIENLLFMYSLLNVEPAELVTSQRYVRAKFGSTSIRHSFYANPINWEMRSHIDSGIDELTLVPFPGELLNSLKKAEIISGNSSVILKCNTTEPKELSVTTTGSKNQQYIDSIPLECTSDGELNLDIRGLRKSMESCKEIGFGPDYLLLVHENNYNQIIVARSM